MIVDMGVCGVKVLKVERVSREVDRSGDDFSVDHGE